MPSVRTESATHHASVNRSPAHQKSNALSAAESPIPNDNDAHGKNIQKRLKTQKKLQTCVLPECVSRIAPDLYEKYNKLLLYEQRLDASLAKQLKLFHDSSKWSPGNKLFSQSRRKLRVHIFNTYENQRSHDSELNTMQQEDLIYTGPPSWTLKLQGSVLERDDSVPACKFSSFFSRIMVITNDETILWDKRLLELTEMDGLEIHRTGDKEQEILIVFFMDYQTPIFSLSDKLSELVGTSRSSLPGIFSGLWEYVLNHNLVSKEDPHIIMCDEGLKQVFEGEVQTFHLQDIPHLLENHIYPPKPVCITHNLRLHGDWIQNANTYDFTVEAMGMYPGDTESVLPDYKNYKDQITIKQQQMDAIDGQTVESFEKLQKAVIQRNFYKAFAEQPVEFINSLLTAKFPDAEKHLLDEYFMRDYRILDQSSSYYQQPWVHRSISKYLQDQNHSFDDQICKVMSCLSIPDHRRYISEEEELNTVSGTKRSRLTSDKTRSAFVKSRRRGKKAEYGDPTPQFQS